MLKNYFKIAFRNIFKNKVYSFINVAGLGLGLATGLLILLWVNNEYFMNRYHSKTDRIYQIEARLKFGPGETVWENTPAPVTLFARENISDIEKIVRFKSDFGAKQVVKSGTTVFIEDKISYTENQLFEIFDFPVVAGNAAKPLADGLSVVLTESTAKKYFGKEDPLGKILRFKDTSFSVSAVIKDFPSYSSIHPDLLFSMEIIRVKFRGNGQWKTVDQDWGNYNYSTFCLMKEGRSTANASAALLNAQHKAVPGASISAFPFVPLKDIYLYNADGSQGRATLVKLFFIIAVFVLLIACINYVNLVTAKATQRVKEISIRKIIGAEKKQLFWQFFTEAGVLLLIAAAIALVLAALLLPLYASISGNTTNYGAGDIQLWKVFALILLLVWLFTGIYPALLLSSFKPLQALKGGGFFSSAGILRKSLVVLQFVVSITLLLGTVFIHRQMNFIQNKTHYVNTDNVLVFDVWKIYEHAADFKNALLQSAHVEAVTAANMSLFEGANSTSDIEWPGKQKGDEMVITQIDVDQQFIPFFKTAIQQGTDFSKTSAGAPDYILNETAIKRMGLKNPIGQTIKFHEQPGTIIGVVKDFHYMSLHNEIAPAVMLFDPTEGGTVYVRFKQSHAKEVVAAAQRIWRSYEPYLPLEYSFLDEQLARQYDKETRAGYLFNAFAVITLFISCLGLFGLAAYSAERRTKEIGIRKVLGANVGTLAALLSKEFVVLVLIAIAVAVPVVYIGMQKLFGYFAYRVQLHWWVFVITCIAAVLAAIITVSVQALKAAMANPVKSLRTE